MVERSETKRSQLIGHFTHRHYVLVIYLLNYFILFKDDDVGLFGAAWRGVKNKFTSKK